MRYRQNKKQQVGLIDSSCKQVVKKWSGEAQSLGQLAEVGNYCTSLDLFGDVIVLAYSDGSMAFYNKAGREEKKIASAHRGGITMVRWNYEGTAITTTGEDGSCKIWSKSGMLRSTIAQQKQPIYAAAWSQDSESLIYCSENWCLHIPVSVQVDKSKQSSWKAHDGIVLCLDWSAVNLGPVWDSFGRLLFHSAPHEHVITSVSWSPNGKSFAVGAFNLLKLCDKSGWTYVRETPTLGSVFSIRWCPDGTQFAGAGGNGNVVFASLIDRSISWQSLDVTLDSSLNTLIVRDLTHETIEELDFRDRVIDFTVAYDQLVFIYTIAKGGLLNTTPVVEDLREAPSLILQSKERFALTDTNGLHVYTYEGRAVHHIRYQGMRVHFFNEKTVSLANDLVAIVDKAEAGKSASVRIFDLHSGKQIQTLEHKQDIVQVALSHERKVAVLDKNKDLFLCPADRVEWQKLSSMVDDFLWNDQTEMLVGLVDQQLQTFLYPNVVFVDPTLLPLTIKTTTMAGSAGGGLGALGAGGGGAGVSGGLAGSGIAGAQLATFCGSHVRLRKTDGSSLAMMVSPFPLLLYEHVQKGHWDLAIRLCRYVKQAECWACLACMGIYARELNSVEIALAAIEEIDKVQYVAYINSLPDDVLKTAELALFCKKPDEAINVLLQNRR
eukprot:g14149.t1